MKLLLTSGGITNESITNALLDLTGRPFSELRLAFIPTAANVEEGDKDWVINDLVKCRELGFNEIDIVDISALPKEIWQPRLEAADVFLAEGGNTHYLMHWVAKSGLRELLPDLLKTRVYVGISAGSMILCPNLDLSQSKNLYSEEVEPGAKDIGLSYVNFLIRPHLNSEYFPNVRVERLDEIAKERSETFYALDDNTAIKVDGDKMEIVSEGVWKKYN